MRSSRWLTVLLAVLVLLAPAGAAAQGRGGTIRVGLDADNTTMDPHRSTAAVDRQVYNNVYGKL
ncbi:MAG: ABC transporter substrate-binding protein, partial [Candidatus Rokubacteria bacterium]|nr:ABC transporter substrate-binding protein [Candidatus Rokubacteria bacterium]